MMTALFLIASMGMTWAGASVCAKAIDGFEASLGFGVALGGMAGLAAGFLTAFRGGF